MEHVPLGPPGGLCGHDQLGFHSSWGWGVRRLQKVENRTHTQFLPPPCLCPVVGPLQGNIQEHTQLLLYSSLGSRSKTHVTLHPKPE